LHAKEHQPRAPAEGTGGFVYQCRLPLSSATLDLVSGLIRGHLKKIGSRWRKLPPGLIALIALAVLCRDQRFFRLGGRQRRLRIHRAPLAARSHRPARRPGPRPEENRRSQAP
jgi:hypothetical protein